MLRERRLDILLTPPHALPAPRHGSTMHLPAAASYCFLINMLYLPAGVVAASRVRPDECSDRPASGDWVEQAAREVEMGSSGLPVGVQVVGKPSREDSVLAVIGKAGAGIQQPPGLSRQAAAVAVGRFCAGTDCIWSITGIECG